jgi:hypothetical protein
LNFDPKIYIVSSKDVTNPVAVRYCFHDFFIGNLRSYRNLPIFSFRSDNWSRAITRRTSKFFQYFDEIILQSWFYWKTLCNKQKFIVIKVYSFFLIFLQFKLCNTCFKIKSSNWR